MLHELARHLRRIRNSIRVGKLTLPTNETSVVQTAQVQLNRFETLDGVISPQLFGLASCVPTGSDVVVLTLGGDNSNPVIIASNHVQYRPVNLGSGETKVYDAMGQYIHLSQQNGKISITISAGQEINISAAANLNIVCPQIAMTGDVLINGKLISTGDQVAAAISLETHIHSHSGGTGTSGPPQ